VDGFAMFATDFGNMTVNAFLAWDAPSKEAVAFDTGSDASEMLEFAAANGLTIRTILITHTHGDHIFDLNRLMKTTGASAFVGDRELSLQGAEQFTAG
jgi:glyoxylase-like metal-dependent hydrolase (beta-lactamase superfamily II)